MKFSPDKETTLLMLVIEKPKNGGYDVAFGVANPAESEEVLFNYISDTIEDYESLRINEMPQQMINLMALIFSTAENIKEAYPDLASAIRKANIEHLKAKK